VEERLFILRWEIIAFLMTLLGTGIIIWALTQLTVAGWIVVALTRLVAETSRRWSRLRTTISRSDDRISRAGS